MLEMEKALSEKGL